MPLSKKLLFQLTHNRVHVPQSRMTDPVIAADGRTYERAAMEEWLQQHNTSPVTGTQLPHLRLVPNVVAQGAIANHLV